MLPFQFALGGVTFGHGTSILVSDVKGLSRPPVRETDVDMWGDGTVPGTDWYAPRSVRISAGIRTPGDPGAALDLLASLEEQADADEVRLTGGAVQELSVCLPGRVTKVIRGRLREVDPDMARLVHGWLPVELTFVGTDTRYYADVDTQAVLPLVRRWQGGFQAPITTPIRVGVGGDNSAELPSNVIENVGSWAAHPVVRITGPVVNPRVWVVGRAASVGVSGYIAAGDWVEIDTDPLRPALRRRSGGSAASLLAPGSDMKGFHLARGMQEVRWEAQEYQAGARLSLTWRTSWRSL